MAICFNCNSILLCRLALKRLTDESSQECFDERRVNLLKLHNFQLQRQVLMLSVFSMFLIGAGNLYFMSSFIEVLNCLRQKVDVY